MNNQDLFSLKNQKKKYFKMSSAAIVIGPLRVKLNFMALEVEPFFNRKHNVITIGIMMLHASNQLQVLCNVWSYHFYDMRLSTE